MGGVDDQDNHLGKGDGPDGVRGGQLFQSLLDPGLPAQPRCVNQPDRASAQGPVHGDRISGDPCFRTGQQPVLADQPVHQGGLARIGTPDDSNAEGAVVVWLRLEILFVPNLTFGGHCGLKVRLVCVLRLLGIVHKGPERGIEVGEPLPMLGRQGNRLPKAQPEGLVGPLVALPPLSLVGDHDDGPVMPAQDISEDFVQLGHAHARVDDEQGHVAFPDGRLGLGAHPGLKAFVGDVLEASGVDQLEVKVTNPARPEATVAGHARAVVDNGQALARKTVEQGRFADVGPADDGESEGHGRYLTDRNEPGLIGHEIEGVAQGDGANGHWFAQLYRLFHLA